MIMQSLANVHDPAKLPTIFPLLESIATMSTISPELFACLFSTFDKSGVGHLHDSSLPYWATFVGIIKNVVSKSSCFPSVFLLSWLMRCIGLGPNLVPIIAEQIKTIFPLLSVQRRVEVASLIVTLAPGSTESVCPSDWYHIELVIIF